MMTAEGAINLWQQFTGVQLNDIQKERLVNLMVECHKAGYCGGYVDGQCGYVHKFPDTKAIIDETKPDIDEPCDECGCLKEEHRHWCSKFDPDAECEHGKLMTDYCQPCGRIHGGS